jgi:hypothetical protein
MWRVLVLFDVLTVAAYVYREWGESAAWLSLAVMAAVLLPLGEIERRLGELVEAQRKRTASK